MVINNGNGRFLRVPLPTLGAVASISGVFIFLFGLISGYLMFKSEMTALTQNIVELKASDQKSQGDLATLRDKVTGMEGDVKYLVQGMAEIKIAIVPRR